MKYIFLFVAIFFATATQLRPDGVPFGLSEMAAFIYILLFMLETKTNGVRHIVEMGDIGFIAWSGVALGASMLAGGVVNLMTINDISERNIIDFFAIAYAFVLAIAVLLDCTKDGRSFKALVYGFGAYLVLMVIFLLLGNFGIDVQFIELWYAGEGLQDEGSRFQGWSNNPNQIGINLSGFMFLYVAIYNHSLTNKEKLIISMFLACSIFLVYAIKSTTIIAMLVFYLIAGFIASIFSGRLSIVKVVLFFMCMVFVAIGMVYIEDVKELISSEVLNKGEEGNLNGRLPIWSNSIQAFLDSPLVGYGPGAHSGFTAPHQGIESHSVYLDLGTQGGILAIIAYLAISIRIAHILIMKRKSLVYWMPFLAVLLYQMSHYTLRYPIYWIVMLSPLILIERAK